MPFYAVNQTVNVSVLKCFLIQSKYFLTLPAILYKWIPQNFFAYLMSYISRGVKVRSGLGLGVRLGLGLGVRLGYGVG